MARLLLSSPLPAFLAASLASFALLTGCSAPAEDASDSSGAMSGEEETTESRDPLREAVKNVDQERVMLDESIPVPDEAGYASANGFSLSGVDWFQKWPDGVSANHDWSKGTDNGKRCMRASLFRFEAIMKNPPRELVALVAQQKEMADKRGAEVERLTTEIVELDNLGDAATESQKAKLEELRGERDALQQLSGWSGSFYNWTDDYNHAQAYGQPSNGKLWSWRSGLTKWISASGSDGACYMPTRKMLVDYAAVCTEQSSSIDKQMQGCNINY